MNGKDAGISESRTYNDNLSDERWKWDAGTEGRPTARTGATRGMGALVDRNRINASVVYTGKYTIWHRVELEDGGCLVVGTGYFPHAQDVAGHEQANKELLGRLLHFGRLGHVVFGGDTQGWLAMTWTRPARCSWTRSNAPGC